MAGTTTTRDAPTAPPPFLGQLIGQAERATRAVLDDLLHRLGVPFDAWVALRQAVVAGGDVGRSTLMGVLQASGIDATRAGAALDLLASSAWTESGPGDRVAVTRRGQALHDEIAASITSTSERLYGHLPVDDVATLRRCLTEIIRRAETGRGGT